MTWASRTQSPSIISVLYSMGPSIHMPGECMRREQSRSGIIIRLFKNGRISFPVISPTCSSSAWIKLPPPPPPTFYFLGKTSPPSYRFVAPPPFPVINDRSLRATRSPGSPATTRPSLLNATRALNKRRLDRQLPAYRRVSELIVASVYGLRYIYIYTCND